MAEKNKIEREVVYKEDTFQYRDKKRVVAKKPEYVFNIHYRTNRRSKLGRWRERVLIKASQEYGVDPGIVLIDRILSDLDTIITDRSVRKSEALKMQQAAERELMQLKVGDK